MGIKDFQNFIEKDPTLSKVGVNGIDLVKTAWKMNKGKGQVRPAGLKKRRCSNQGCGSGTGSGSVLDPYSIGSVDPDPYSGSGSRRAKNDPQK